MTTSLLELLAEIATRAATTNSTASGSSPFTWNTGASTIFATSVQYSVERASCGSLIVKPTWLLMTRWTVPPRVEAARLRQLEQSPSTTPWPANAASPWISTGRTCSPRSSPRRSWRARTEPSTTGSTISRCDGLNASARCTGAARRRTSAEKPMWYLTSPECPGASRGRTCPRTRRTASAATCRAC